MEIYVETSYTVFYVFVLWTQMKLTVTEVHKLFIYYILNVFVHNDVICLY